MLGDCYTDPVYDRELNSVSCAGDNSIRAREFSVRSNMVEDGQWSFDVYGLTGTTSNNVDRETLEFILKVVQTALEQSWPM